MVCDIYFISISRNLRVSIWNEGYSRTSCMAFFYDITSSMPIKILAICVFIFDLSAPFILPNLNSQTIFCSDRVLSCVFIFACDWLKYHADHHNVRILKLV